MTGMRCKTAEKEYRCIECGRLIPIGDKHWTKPGTTLRQHTNCLAYVKHEELNLAFNSDRSRRKA